MVELLGIATDLAARRKAVRESLEKRGASEASIARFPAPAKPMPPLPTRSMLAKPEKMTSRPKAVRVNTGPTPGEALQIYIKHRPIAREVGRVGLGLPPCKTARIKAIAGEVARAAGVSTEQVLAYRALRYGQVAKHLAVYFASKLTDVPIYRLARVFNYRDATGARYAIQKADYQLIIGNPVAWAVHDRAISAIKARWPEYANYAAPVVMQQAA